jgi:hypothetical protein
MAPLPLLERPETGHPRPEAGLVHPAPAVSPTPLARFLLDPMAFASGEAATAAPSLVHAYVQGLDRRLAQVLGAPPRLATLAAPPGPGLAPAVPSHGTDAPPGDGAPRLAGAVVLAMAVVAVAVATAAAGAAAVLARRDAN